MDITEEVLRQLFLNKIREKSFGEIKAYCPIKLDRKEGYLVWDYQIVNEISFVTTNPDDFVSMFASVNIVDTKSCYNQITARYGNKN